MVTTQKSLMRWWASRTWIMTFLLSTAAACDVAMSVPESHGAGQKMAASRSNVIMVYADDLGYGDVGCYGGALVPTPAIDRLAAEGIRCTQGYVTSPVCAPSRAGLLGGAYQQRFGMQWNVDRKAYRFPEGHKIMPEAFKDAGYATCSLGKWNIPREPVGIIDEMYCRIDWESDYFPDANGFYEGVDDPVNPDSSKTPFWGPKKEGDAYVTDRLGNHAVDFIRRHKDEPFFMYLAFNAVHTPLQAKKSYESRVTHIKEEPLRMYACMLISLDENLGRVLDVLDETGLTEDTLVAFVSDNGPARGPVKGWKEHWPQKDFILGSAGFLRGHKGQYYEGGIREPFVLRWPSKWKPGQVYDHPISTLDLYPTFCSAAGIAINRDTRLEGVDLAPYLAGERKERPHETLYWLHDGTGAIRQGDWKLIVSRWPPILQLFDLAKDPSESADLAGSEADQAARLKQAWDDWVAEMPPPAAPEKRKKSARPKPTRIWVGK